MSLRTWILAAAAAGIAASLVSRARRDRVVFARAEQLPDTLPVADTTAVTADGGTLPAPGSETLNAGERLNDEQLTGSPMAPGTPLAEASESDELFDSSSQKGSTPVMTGLPDFSRGA